MTNISSILARDHQASRPRLALPPDSHHQVRSRGRRGRGSINRQMWRNLRLPILCAALGLGALSHAATAAKPPEFNSGPWLKDLEVARHAFLTKYSDLEWAVLTRHVDLAKVFAETAEHVRDARNDED